MNNTKNRTNSTLASHIWDLKDRGIDHDVGWKIKSRGTQYNPSTKKCRICLKEKHFILYKGEGATLNSRGEIFNTCRHRKTNLLSVLKKAWKIWVLISFLFHPLFPFRYRRSNFNLCNMLKICIPDECNFVTVIWNKPVELQIFHDLFICVTCSCIFAV